MATSRDICRLCLEVSSNIDVLDDRKRRMLEQITSIQNLTLIDHPLVCFECRDSLEQFYGFKMTCLNNERLFFNCGSNIELKLGETVQRHADQIVIKTEEENVCLFCLKCLENDGFVKFVMDEDTYLKDMLHKCLPEIIPSITNQQLICDDCIRNLQNMYSFVINCLNNERRLKEYMQVIGTTSNGEINLSNVLKFNCNIKNDEKMLEIDLNFIKCETASSSGMVDKKEEVFGKFQDDDISREILDSTSCNVTVKKEEFDQLEENEIDIKDEQDVSKEADIEIAPNNCREDIESTDKRSLNTMHKCTECSFESKYKSNLRMHTKIHKDKSEITMYRCRECNFESKYNYSLQKHLIFHVPINNPDVPTHKCTKCIFESRYKSSLRTHMLSHKDNSEIPIHKCTECSYESKHRNSLRRHMLVHKRGSEVVMYKCSKCSFETKHKGYLLKHDRFVHADVSEITVYKCMECSYKSKQKVHLQGHLLVHHASKDV